MNVSTPTRPSGTGAKRKLIEEAKFVLTLGLLTTERNKFGHLKPSPKEILDKIKGEAGIDYTQSDSKKVSRAVSYSVILTCVLKPARFLAWPASLQLKYQYLYTWLRNLGDFSCTGTDNSPPKFRTEARTFFLKRRVSKL